MLLLLLLAERVNIGSILSELLDKRETEAGMRSISDPPLCGLVCCFSIGESELEDELMGVD